MMLDGDAEPAEPIDVQERLRLFQRLAQPYFEQADGAKLQFGLLLLLVLLDAGVSVGFSYTGRDFYSALSAKDQAVFLEKTLAFGIGLAVATPLTVLFRFQRARLALSWREWMTTELARQYYAEMTYYRIETTDTEIDNPDQRITEDVKAFTQVCKSHLCNSPRPDGRVRTARPVTPHCDPPFPPPPCWAARSRSTFSSTS